MTAAQDSLDLLDGREERFGSELLTDLTKRHPHVLGAVAPPPASIVDLLRAFVTTHDDELDVESAHPDVADLADSIMKTFALVVGRSAWKPAMALDWLTLMRQRGGRLLAAFRRP